LFPDLSRIVWFTFLLVVSVPLPLLADEFKLVPGLSLKEEYNDNIFLATSARRSDYITTLTPSLEISRAAERRNLSLSSGLNWLTYTRNHKLNSLDYYVQAGAGYQLEPRLSFSTGASYVRDSRPDRLDQGGLTLKSGSDRQNYQLSGNYAVSELSTSSASYSYSQENFDNTGSVTNRVHSVTFGQDYDLDRYLRQTKLVGNLGYSRNLTDTSLVDNYTLSLGFTQKIQELWTVSLSGGGRYTRSEFDQNRTSVKDDDLGWIANLAASYGGEKTNASFALNHDITTAAGRNGTTERSGASATFSERFTRELSCFMGLGFSWNRSNQNQFSSQAIDEKNLTANTGVRYDFSDHVFLEGNYRYNLIRNSQLSTQAIQNVFMVRLTMRRDLLDL
jgi:opacity protein-like surface antigen